MIHKYSLLLLILLLSCKPKEPEQEAKYPIVVKNNPSSLGLVSIRDLMEDVEYIKLSSSDRFFLSSASKISSLGDKIFIRDKNKKALVSFDQAGNFLGTVGTKGLGPGEYRSVTDFDVHPQRNSIFVFSRGDKAILEFDYDLKFKKQFIVENWAFGMSVLSNGQIAVYTYFDARDNNILIYDPDTGIIVDERMPYPSSLVPKSMDYTGYLRGDYYTYPLSSRVYRLNMMEELDSAYFDISFPDQRPEELKFEHEEYLTETNRLGNEILGDFSVGESGQELIFYYGYRVAGRSGITLGVRTRSGEVFGHTKLKHGGRSFSEAFVKLFFLSPYNLPKYSKKDGYYYVIPTQEGMYNVYGPDRESFLNEIKDTDKQLHDLLYAMNDGDNPILMRFRLKDMFYSFEEK